jgi:hypothetical protein
VGNSEEKKHEIFDLVNQSLIMLSEKKWPEEFTSEERDLTVGLLNVTAGWYPQIKVGQKIEVNKGN